MTIFFSHFELRTVLKLFSVAPRRMSNPHYNKAVRTLFIFIYLKDLVQRPAYTVTSLQTQIQIPIIQYTIYNSNYTSIARIINQSCRCYATWTSLSRPVRISVPNRRAVDWLHWLPHRRPFYCSLHKFMCTSFPIKPTRCIYRNRRNSQCLPTTIVSPIPFNNDRSMTSRERFIPHFISSPQSCFENIQHQYGLYLFWFQLKSNP